MLILFYNCQFCHLVELSIKLFHLSQIFPQRHTHILPDDTDDYFGCALMTMMTTLVVLISMICSWFIMMTRQQDKKYFEKTHGYLLENTIME